MRRSDAWLVGPVVVAIPVVLLLNRGEISRADYFLFEVLGISLVLWILLGVGNGVRCAIRDRKR